MRLLVILFLIALITISFAVTWYVNATAASSCLTQYTEGATCGGGSCNMSNTIKDAVTNASTGDTIIVCRNASSAHFTTAPIITITTKALNIFGNQSNTGVNLSSGSQMFVIDGIGADVSGTNISNFTFGAVGTGQSALVIQNTQNVSVSNNTFWGTSQGIIIYNVVGVTITNNTLFDVGIAGILANQSNNSLYRLNRLYNGSASYFYFQNGTNNTIRDNIVNNTLIGFLIDGENRSNFTSNTVYNNSVAGFNVTSTNNSFFSSNTVYNNSIAGFYISGGSINNTFANNNVQNHTYNFYLAFTSAYNTFRDGTLKWSTNGFIFDAIGNNHNNTISNNTIVNTTVGILVTGNPQNNITLNNITNFSSAGISVSLGPKNRIFFNTIYNPNPDQFGILIHQATTTFIYNNNVSSVNYGVYVNGSSNFTNLSQNNVSLSVRGIYLSNSSNSTIESNFVFNNTQYGFYFEGGTANNLTENNASNNSFVQYHFVSGSNVTFTGPNRALNTNAAAGVLDLNISGGSNATTLVGSTYNNFTSENLTIFFHNAFNVSIKFLTNNSAGAAKSSCSPSSASSDTLSKDCVLVSFGNGFNTVVNITNTSSSISKISLGIYFNTTDGVDSTDASVQIARYSSGWLEVGRTAYDGTAGSVRYDDITSFSLFGAVRFRENKASSGAATSVQPLSIDFAIAAKLTCPGNLLELVATSNSKSISDVLVSLILYEPYEGLKQEKSTNADGKVLFDLTNEKLGKYQLESSKTGYQKPEDIFFDFSSCLALQPIKIIKESVESEPTIEPTPQPLPQPETLKEQVLKVIQDAEDTITKAEKENKDASVAKLKLREANDAFANGDYEKAANFAAEALQLANNAMLGSKPHSATPTPVPVPEQSKEEPAEQSGGLDLGQIVLGLAAVGVVGFAIYKLFAKKGYGGFKK